MVEKRAISRDMQERGCVSFFRSFLFLDLLAGLVEGGEFALWNIFTPTSLNYTYT